MPRPRDPEEHGTVKGFSQHISRGTGPCTPCRAAWNDYNFRRGALLLSARDKKVVNAITASKGSDAIDIAVSYGWIAYREDGKGLKDNRERMECEVKLQSLGISAPWLRTGNE